MNLLTASVFLSPSNKILLSPEKNDFGKYLSLPHILTTALRELNCSGRNQLLCYILWWNLPIKAAVCAIQHLDEFPRSIIIIIIIIIIISLLNPLVVYNTKLQGRSRIRRTHNYTWHRRQKQLNPIVTVGNKITKAVRSDKAEFRTGKTRPQPVPMRDIRGLQQQVWKEPGLLDVRYKTPASLICITARQQCRQAIAHVCRLIRAIWKNYS